MSFGKEFAAYMKQVRSLFGDAPEKGEAAWVARGLLAKAWSEITTRSPDQWDRLLQRLKFAVEIADAKAVGDVDIFPAEYPRPGEPFRVIGYVPVFDNGWPDGKIYGQADEAWERESHKPGFVRLAQVREMQAQRK